MPFKDADPSTRKAFVSFGQRQGYFEPSEDTPEDWYCEEHRELLSRDELLGLAYGAGLDPMPVCMMSSCPGRGWARVHPWRQIPSLVVGGGGQAPSLVPGLRVRPRR